MPVARLAIAVVVMLLPATTSTAPEPDLSTPEAAIRAFADAVDAADLDQLRQIAIPGDASERIVVHLADVSRRTREADEIVEAAFRDSLRLHHATPVLRNYLKTSCSADSHS